MISAYRSASGSGVRLDGGTAYAGAQISAHFDSLLVKVTCRGRDFTTAVRRARRALAEFRVRGVSTNIPFLMALLDEPDFREGRVTTSFIAEHPHLLTARAPADRGTRLMSYLADVTVNKPQRREAPHLADPREKLPGRGPRRSRRPTGPSSAWASSARRASPRGCARETTVGVTDTTFRDAHQSLLATRVRTRDLLEVAPHVARTTPELLSLECWGGATYDVALRFLAEDPWERLAPPARGGPEHLPADAAARAQHRRLHALPDRGHRRLRRRGRPHRHRHLPDLRRAQRHQPDAAGDRRGAPVRRGRRRGRPLLHRRPDEPGREALHARLLPGAGRADRRGRGARPGDQGHGRAAPPPGGAQARRPRCASASTCPCTCTPTTPRAASSPR